ncbi:uncharacterized protein IL334_007551 [Kwoniella shivajii]|uniref:BZIP domain-containing protein n=1 Tax=Kwoniella shivajii TaxID=564305 RepID=A0ABZ1D8Z2_9TREE|nr:hypothetical protein IL334_007551 [Kwoniella shivajii]
MSDNASPAATASHWKSGAIAGSSVAEGELLKASSSWGTVGHNDRSTIDGLVSDSHFGRSDSQSGTGSAFSTPGTVPQHQYRSTSRPTQPQGQYQKQLQADRDKEGRRKTLMTDLTEKQQQLNELQNDLHKLQTAMDIPLTTSLG